MALLLPRHNAVFLHVPKTGGLFITNFLKSRGIPAMMIGYRHSPADLIGLKGIGKFKFCFIREPVAWYKSYWQMRIREVGGKGGHLGIGQDLGGPHPLFHPTWEIDPYCMDNDLNKYLMNCAELDGYLVRTYRRFIGHGIYKVNYVGRFEHFHDDLMEVFDSIGVKYDKRDLITAKKYNPSQEVQQVSEKARKAVEKAEAEYKLIDTGWI